MCRRRKQIPIFSRLRARTLRDFFDTLRGPRAQRGPLFAVQNSEKSKNFPGAGWYNGAIRPEEVDAVAKRLLVYGPGLLSLACGALLTPLFEELLFRGWVWRGLERHGQRAAYLGSAALFGLWHLGYVPSILWRTALLGRPAAPLEAAAWKVLAGTVFGLLFGAARYKSGRICPSLLLHMAVNTFGSRSKEIFSRKMGKIP